MDFLIPVMVCDFQKIPTSSMSSGREVHALWYEWIQNVWILRKLQMLPSFIWQVLKVISSVVTSICLARSYGCEHRMAFSYHIRILLYCVRGVIGTGSGKLWFLSFASAKEHILWCWIRPALPQQQTSEIYLKAFLDERVLWTPI